MCYTWKDVPAWAEPTTACFIKKFSYSSLRATAWVCLIIPACEVLHVSQERAAIIIVLVNARSPSYKEILVFTVRSHDWWIVQDLSGRPHLSYDLQIPTAHIGTYDTQLVEHFFQSVVNTSGMTLHIRQLAGSNSHHIVEATFKAFARALRKACEVDPRRAGKIASSKGVLTQQWVAAGVKYRSGNLRARNPSEMLYTADNCNLGCMLSRSGFNMQCASTQPKDCFGAYTI